MMADVTPSIDLTGKIALITGAGGGIGKATALAFAELGATIYALEISKERVSELRSLMCGDHIILDGDVRVAEDIERIISAINEAHGKLDILVNNVGDSLRLRGPFESRSEEDWAALYEINLKHIFSVTRASLPLIRATGTGGSIINMSTIEAHRGAPPAAIYAAFKAAITGFTKSLALELAPEGIRVNIIAPETTETIQVPVSQMIAPEHREHISRWIPMGRFGVASDAAGSAFPCQRTVLVDYRHNHTC